MPPMPPTTAAVKLSRPANPMKWLIWLNISPNTTPAAPARTELMKNGLR
jgi:hypothetical protein